MTAWTDPRGGEGSWEPTGEHGGSLLTAFIVCLLGCVLFIGLVTAGRAGMCKLYRDRPQPPSYCTAAEK